MLKRSEIRKKPNELLKEEIIFGANNIRAT